MIKELDDIRVEVEKDPDERDLEKARSMADTYIEQHPDEFTEYAGMTRSACVIAVDGHRAAGMLDSQWRTETWLLHHFHPVELGANIGPLDQIRTPEPVDQIRTPGQQL